MVKHAQQEVDYRLSKWLIRNAGIEQFLTPDEMENVFRELLSFYPQSGVRAVHHGTGKVACHCDGIRRSALEQPGGKCNGQKRQDDGVHDDRRN